MHTKPSWPTPVLNPITEECTETNTTIIQEQKQWNTRRMTTTTHKRGAPHNMRLNVPRIRHELPPFKNNAIFFCYPPHWLPHKRPRLLNICKWGSYCFPSFFSYSISMYIYRLNKQLCCLFRFLHNGIIMFSLAYRALGIACDKD